MNFYLITCKHVKIIFSSTEDLKTVQGLFPNYVITETTVPEEYSQSVMQLRDMPKCPHREHADRITQTHQGYYNNVIIPTLFPDSSQYESPMFRNVFPDLFEPLPQQRVDEFRAAIEPQTCMTPEDGGIKFIEPEKTINWMRDIFNGATGNVVLKEFFKGFNPQICKQNPIPDSELQEALDEILKEPVERVETLGLGIDYLNWLLNGNEGTYDNYLTELERLKRVPHREGYKETVKYCCGPNGTVTVTRTSNEGDYSFNTYPASVSLPADELPEIKGVYLIGSKPDRRVILPNSNIAVKACVPELAAATVDTETKRIWFNATSSYVKGYVKEYIRDRRELFMATSKNYIADVALAQNGETIMETVELLMNHQASSVQGMALHYMLDNVEANVLRISLKAADGYIPCATITHVDNSLTIKFN